MFSQYMSKRKAASLTGTEKLLWFDQVGIHSYQATVTSATPTQLVVNAGSKGGAITYDLTGDQSTNIPVVQVFP